MRYKLKLLKTYYIWGREINKRSERERASVLVLVTVGLFGLWSLLIYGFQSNALKDAQTRLSLIGNDVAALQSKKSQIEQLSTTPDVQQLIKRHADLKRQLEELERRAIAYNKRYINPKDLSMMLRDMAAASQGVRIIDLSTLAAIHPMDLPQDPLAQESPDNKKNTSGTINLGFAVVEPMYYRLVLKGDFFGLMGYLKRMEQLSWRLYWDSFDYTIDKYPEGIATITFYTLKPVSDPSNPPANGGSP